MTGRHDIAEPAMRNLILRSPPNWTAVIFFLILGGMHLTIASSAMLNGRWDGYLSVILGGVFLLVGALCTRARFELAILTAQRRMRLRSGIGRLSFEREIPFSAVHAVRLTLLQASDYPNSRIEVLCDQEDVQCPPTTIPRQQALCLALLMNVRLIKVSTGPDEPADLPERHEHVSRL
jgi:hypothetical protein